MANWKVTLPCTRAEAEALSAAQDAEFDADAPTLVFSEVIDWAEADQPEGWRVEAYFASKPKQADLAALKAALPSSNARPRPEKLPEQDWVTLSQQGLEPIRAGRFHIHTPDHPAAADPAMISLEISAGLAFGTGHHETTAGCLEMLDAMRTRGVRVRNAIDCGTGTGLLALGALRLWPRAYMAASDIDPLCEPVVAENAARNGAVLGARRGQIDYVTAPGLDHPVLQHRAPYDLVMANILAGPLIELAPDIARAMSRGGQLVLAGLLNQQAEDVLAAYRWHRLRLVERRVRGDWTILWLTRRRQWH